MNGRVKTKLINRSQVRQFALDVSKSTGRKFTRVGGDFFLMCEGRMKEIIRCYVHRLPSIGKTIQ